MALDEAMLLHHEAGGALPTLRVYGWTTPTCLSAMPRTPGRRSTWRRANNPASLWSAGRLAAEPSCTIAKSPIVWSCPSRCPRSCYTDGALSTHWAGPGTRRCNVWVWPCISNAPVVGAATSCSGLPACFAAIARYELSAAGKKIVGSAQKRLQHTYSSTAQCRCRWSDNGSSSVCGRCRQNSAMPLVQEAFTTMTAINEIAPSPVTAYAAARRCGGCRRHIRCRSSKTPPVLRRRTSRRRTVHHEIHQPGVEPGRCDGLAPKRGASHGT